jgi:hypothetical protein
MKPGSLQNPVSVSQCHTKNFGVSARIAECFLFSHVDALCTIHYFSDLTTIIILKVQILIMHFLHPTVISSSLGLNVLLSNLPTDSPRSMMFPHIRIQHRFVYKFFSILQLADCRKTGTILCPEYLT